MKNEIFRFRDLVIYLQFYNQQEEDNNIGIIKAENAGNTHLFWETFHGHEQRNLMIAWALKAVANHLEEGEF